MMTIDFKELPDDGIRFEQLIREILLRNNLEVHWTGVGSDGGRDLIAIESAQGKLASFQRTWLVSCKHYAHSGKSVGVKDTTDIIDTCKAIGADGFLLACSTQPSSAAIKRFEELESNNNLKIRYWDGIEIEKRLRTPSTFPLKYIFFPESSKDSEWVIYNTTSPSSWAANYKDYFLYLGSRIANTFPDLKDVEEIIRRLELIQLPKGSENNRHYIRPRAVYFDEKHEQFSVFADYLYPKGKIKEAVHPKKLNEILRDGCGLYADDTGEWYITHWDIQYIRTSQISDHFHLDHRDYYKKHMENFRWGSARDVFISEMDTYVFDEDIPEDFLDQ